MNWLAVFIGGGVGSILRYGVTWWAKSWPTHPLAGTFVSNVLASLVLALVVFGAFKNLIPGTPAFLFLAVGVAGGFSTFSTFSMENVMLIREGQPYLALLNIVVNVAVCFALIWFVSKRV